MIHKVYAEDFGEVFIKEDISAVLDSYACFRKMAIIDCKEFKKLKIILERKKEFFMGIQWKAFVYECFIQIMEVCMHGGTNSREKRQTLINVIDMILLDTINYKDRVGMAPCLEADPDKRLAVLRLIMDVICAFSVDPLGIQYMAMIYDMVHNSNEQDIKFEVFYGAEAEKIIIENTLSIVEILAEDAHMDAKSWLKNILDRHYKKFVLSFGDCLLTKLDSRRNNNPMKQALEENKEKQKKKKGNILIQLSGLCLVVILCLTAGCLWVKSNNDEAILEAQALKIESLEKRINEIEDLCETLQKDIEAADGVDLGYDESKVYIMPVERNLRSEKSTESEENILDTISKGEEVTILEEADENGWMKVKYKSLRGYILIQGE